MASRERVRGFTIDGEHSRDLDDAFWVTKTDTGYCVEISISDAAKAVSKGSEPDLDAQARVETVYRRYGNKPMLPRDLAEDKLSLLPGKARKTLTVRVDLDESGRAVSSAVTRTRLRSLFRLSHKRCDEELMNPSGRFHAQLSLCQELANKLYDSRRLNGALALYDVDSHLYADEDGIIRKYEGDFFHAQMIVQEFMILANEQIATLLAKSGRLAIYRNHRARASAPNRTELLSRVSEAISTRHALMHLRQQMQLWMDRAQYGLSVEGHYGLGLAAYCHFTSPIRRYVDLVQHRIVRSMLKGEPEPYSRDELQRIVDSVNEWHRAQDEASETYFKEKAAKEMRVVSQGSAESLGSLSMSAFSRVVKQAIKDDKPTPDLESVLQDRIRRGEISPFDLYYLAFHSSSRWKSREALAEELPKKPHFSIMMLEILQQRDAAKYMITTIGSFQSVVTVEWNGSVTVSEAKQSSSKKHSQALAASSWIVGHMQGSNQPPGAVKLEQQQQSGFVNWVGLLNEWCQTKQQEVVFRYESDGPPHQPSFKCYGTLGELVAVANAATKKDAKKLVAEKLVAMLPGGSA